MLLNMNPPTCEADMHRATNLALDALGHLAQLGANPYDQAAFKRTCPQAKTIVGKQEVRDAIEAIMLLKPNERQRLHDAFVHDIEFRQYLDDANFEFQFRNLPKAIKEAGTQLMVAFYTNVMGKGGFKGLAGQVVQTLDLSAVEDGYRAANPGYDHMCPACLGNLPPSVKGRTLVDREHYFPKSKYAPLAVHPGNLTLACTACNQRVHGDKDPIQKSGPGELKSIFAPYTGDHLRKLSLAFDNATQQLVTVQPAPHAPKETKQRFESIDHMYELTTRWRDSMARIHEQVVRNLKYRVVDPVGQEQVFTSQLVIEQQTVRDQIDTKYDAFLEAEYLRWILSDPTLIRALARNVAAVRAAAGLP